MTPNLHDLDLSRNSLGSAGAAAVADFLLITTVLRKLDLTWNDLQGKVWR